MCRLPAAQISVVRLARPTSCRNSRGSRSRACAAIIGALYDPCHRDKGTAQVACRKEMAVYSIAIFARVRRSIASVVLLIACALGPGAAAHEIPTDIKINVFVRPLLFLLRAGVRAFARP